VALLLGVAVGGAAAWLVARGHFASTAAADRAALQMRLASAETVAPSIVRERLPPASPVPPV